jgi:hypothetical protein
MSQDKKVVAETKLSEEEKLLEEKTAGFIKSIAKTNTQKITKEILEGLSEDTDDSDSYDAESGGEDSEYRPWRPSHAVFGKSTIKQSHLDNMRGRYFRDMSTVRADADRVVPAPEENEVVIYRSFFKAGLRFLLSRFVVEVLKTYQIFLYQITPEAIVRMGIFVWAIRSQGLEPSAKCFCSMHELSYVTNPSEGGLVRLKYTFRFGDQFIEPDDDWLKCVENTSDELLGAYSKSEDNALSAAFGSRKKKRLNRVFDAIGFVYPDYRYPPRGQKRKGATSGKTAASAASSEPAPKRKKLKVFTHRPRYIEPATVPEFDGETSSVIEAKEHALMQKKLKSRLQCRRLTKLKNREPKGRKH